MKKVCEYDEKESENYKQCTRDSLVKYNLSYCDLMETVSEWMEVMNEQTIENNRMEGKTRSQRKERQLQNAMKYH